MIGAILYGLICTTGATLVVATIVWLVDQFGGEAVFFPHTWGGWPVAAACLFVEITIAIAAGSYFVSH